MQMKLAAASFFPDFLEKYALLRAGALLLLAFAVFPRAQAEQKPLWEAGLGIGALVFPDYRGSNETHAYPVPVPYFVYRGDFFKADREGLRGEFFDREYAELNISVNATIPVQSDHNRARRGMPNLRATVEAGPSLNLHVWHSADREMKFDVVLPLRFPLTIESSPKLIGWNFSPRLNLDVRDVAGQAGWNFGIGVGPMFAAQKYHRYFYSVASRYAKPDRQAYDAKGGYSGLQIISALSKRFPKYWIGAYIRYDALQGAQFEDSPLVKQEHYVAGGVGIAWLIGESTHAVEESD
jgi:outer membrane protein